MTDALCAITLRKVYVHTENRHELYIIMSKYISYAPDFSNDDLVRTQERAQERRYSAIENVFAGDPDVHARMNEAADAAFLASREGRKQDARDSFGIIMDELSDVLRPPVRHSRFPPYREFGIAVPVY